MNKDYFPPTSSSAVKFALFVKNMANVIPLFQPYRSRTSKPALLGPKPKILNQSFANKNCFNVCAEFNFCAHVEF